MEKKNFVTVVKIEKNGRLDDTRYSFSPGSDYRDDSETSRLLSSLTSHPSRLLQQHYVSKTRTCISVACIFLSSRHSRSLVDISSGLHSRFLPSLSASYRQASCLVTISPNQSHRIKRHQLSLAHLPPRTPNTPERYGHIQSFRRYLELTNNFYPCQPSTTAASLQ